MARVFALVLLGCLPLHHRGALANEFPSSDPVTSAEAADAVLILDSVSLGEVLEDEVLLMINFYAPWCGHCQQLEPEYTKAAQDLQTDGLFLAKIDCDANEELCDEDKWDIEGLPAIKVARGRGRGPIHDYNGPKSAASIAAFMRQVNTLPVTGLGNISYDKVEDDVGEDDDYYYTHTSWDEEEGVLVLGAHSFDDAADHFVLMLVVFYFPGSDSSAALRQEYLEASDVLYEYQIPVGKVDCFAQADLCRQPRWKDAAIKAGAGIDISARPGDEDGHDSDGSVVIGGKAPALFVVREGEVFGHDGDPPFRAFDMVEFVKELAGIDDDDDDDEEDEEGGGGVEVDETNVLVLDETNFRQTLEENDVVLLEFFAPWCGNCQRLQPRYARAADALVKEGNVARLAKIDCMENASLCAQEPWSIDRYPTMILRRFGNLHRVNEPPEAKDIVRLMRKAGGPALQNLSGKAALDSFILKNEVAVVGIMEREGSPAHQKFKEAAESDFGRAYGVTFDDGVAEFFGVASGSKVVALRHFDTEKLSMQVFSFTKKEDIEAFVRGASQKFYLKYGTDEATQVLSKRPVVIFVLTEEERFPSAETKEMMQLTQTMAKNALVPPGEKAVHDVVRYVHASMDEEGLGLLDFLIGEENRVGSVPGVFLAAPGVQGNVLKYRQDGELTVQGLEQFERRYFAGELKPYLRSEPISIDDERGLVKRVKADSFERIVIDNDNDVLVEFYDPWCPHCKRLEPVYELLAAKMEGRENLVIAEMDVTANDINVPGVSTTKVPSVLMFNAGSKHKPQKYEGEMELERLEAFVNELARHKQQAAAVATGESPRRDEL